MKTVSRKAYGIIFPYLFFRGNLTPWLSLRVMGLMWVGRILLSVERGGIPYSIMWYSRIPQLQSLLKGGSYVELSFLKHLARWRLIYSKSKNNLNFSFSATIILHCSNCMNTLKFNVWISLTSWNIKILREDKIIFWNKDYFRIVLYISNTKFSFWSQRVIKR